MRRASVLSVLMLVLTAWCFGAVVVKVIDTPELLPKGPGAKGRLGDFVLQNDTIKVVVSALDHYWGYMKSGGNIIDIALTKDNIDLLDEMHTYFGWPEQAIYNRYEISVTPGGAIGTLRLYGIHSDYPEIKVITEYTICEGDPFITVKTTLINEGTREFDNFKFGDAVFLGYAQPFLYGLGFKVGRCETPLAAGVGLTNHVAYGFTTLETDPETYGLRPITIEYIYFDPIVKVEKLAPGERKSYKRLIFVGRSLADIQEEVFVLRGEEFVKIRGRVVTCDGKPIEGAWVELVGKDGRTYSQDWTDSEGRYRLIAGYGRYKISVRSPGYEPAGIEVETKPGEGIIRFVRAIELLEKDTNSFVWKPYLTNLTENGVTISWRTEVPATAVVEYGPLDEYNKTGLLIGKITVTEAKAFQQVRVTGLKPGTYAYRVRILTEGKRELVSPVATFTIPSRSTTKFRFVVYGDTRTFNKRHRKVAEAIAREKPLFVINVGDLVSDARNLWDLKDFFWAIEPIAKSTPYYSTLGNHEYNSVYYYQAFDFPRGGGDYGKRWYSFTIGNVHVVVLDSNVWRMDRNLAMLREQTEWLKKDLASTTAKFKIVVFHHPLYVNDSEYRKTRVLRDLWHPIFKKYGVDMVFSGHIHAYERFVVDGINYVVTAGGGAPLYKLNENKLPETVKSIENIHHYVLVEVDGDTMKVKVIGVLKQTSSKEEDAVEPINQIIDEFKIEHKSSLLLKRFAA